ncbi:MAG: hypothetical protein QM718_12820 [Steroidobacteraceae bacterium]
MKTPRRLVVQVHAPARRWLTNLALAAAVVAGLWITYEIGRRVAGYDSRMAAQQRDALQEQVDQLQRTQKELRVQLAAADEVRLAQVRERTEVGKTIGELQAQVARLSQDLEFYRGMVTQQSPRTIGLRVQQFRVTGRPEQGGYLLRFTVNRTTSAEQSFSGTLMLSVEGTRAGSAASVDLSSITQPRQTSLALNFRYFTTIEQAIMLPEGFTPQSVTVEIRPAKQAVAPYRQSFIWNVETG